MIGNNLNCLTYKLTPTLHTPWSTPPTLNHTSGRPTWVLHPLLVHSALDLIPHSTLRMRHLLLAISSLRHALPLWTLICSLGGTSHHSVGRLRRDSLQPFFAITPHLSAVVALLHLVANWSLDCTCFPFYRLQPPWCDRWLVFSQPLLPIAPLGSQLRERERERANCLGAPRSHQLPG